MAEYDLSDLYDKYEGFTTPVAKVYLGGQDPEADTKAELGILDINVEITSDFKASIATLTLTGAFSENAGVYDMKVLKKYVALGTDVRILLGHADSIMEVFRGYIARVDFLYQPDVDVPGSVRITAMDIKGIMMANNTSKRLKANYYSDAVKEILDSAVYKNLVNAQVITDIAITDTPDKPGGGAGGEAPGGGAAAGGAPGGAGGQAPDIRIEMVAESDYEFIVRAAKKFNYEFFTIGGNVAFRKAKANTQELIDIIPATVIQSFDIGYDLTGVVGEVKVRTIDIGKAQKIEATKKNTGKFSLGSKAKPLISGQSYVYTDSSIETKDDADRRAAFIMEDISYRLGSLNMTLAGMPELVPGRFVNLKGFGDGVSNKYYLTDVIHDYSGGTFTTTIMGKASTL